MALTNGSGLTYVGDDGRVSTYHMYLENRVVFHVLVDNDDPHLRVGYAHPNWLERGDAVLYREGMHTHMMLDTRQAGVEPTDVRVIERVSASIIQAQIYAMLPFLLADVYVPKMGDE